MNRLSSALRLALAMGMMTGAFGAYAQTTSDGTTTAPTKSTSAPPKPSQAKQLTGVTVTGSLLRRVDTETASPVVTVDAKALADTGKPTLGQVLQQLPSFAGTAANTSNNSNGGGVASPTLEGGDGAARVSLRGLGSGRTLVLIDGQRMINPDLNMIPVNMIERVDVLAEGASTVYGSDAIGGVVNVILKKHYHGVEATVNDGVSSHGDGQRHGFTFTAGANGDKGNIVVGLNYNKYDPILASRRSFSAHQLYLYSGGPVVAGSSTVPTGYLRVPASYASRYGCSASSSGTINLTRASGDGSSLGDYRCYSGSDAYNYNAFNYIETAQERMGAFLSGHYDFSSNVTLYGTVLYNHTDSSGQDAPPGVYVTDGWSIPASNPINPFGVDFSSTGYTFKTRLSGLGTRLHTYSTDNLESVFGLRGNYGQSTWSWDASINYGYYNRSQKDFNEIKVSSLQSLIDNGLNLFDQNNSAVVSQLQSAAEGAKYQLVDSLKQAQFTSTGDLWDLPAGTVQLSAGALYRQEAMNYTVTPDAVLNTSTLTCNLIQEACGSPGRGSYNVKEAFAESLVPLLSNVPGAYSLNLDLGIRSSDYSTSGTTTDKKIALEWRPISDLLVRGTVSQVFRSPNLDQLYDGVTISNPTVNDPCVGLTAAQLAAHPTACAGVNPGYTGGANLQINALYSGSHATGEALKPEQGKSVDIGFVYSPSWLTGFSSSLDFWHIYLYNMLTNLAGQTVLDSCYANASSPYCSYIHRYASTSTNAGDINYINAPVVNLGNLSTTGIDFTSSYRIPHFNLGGYDPGYFKLGLNTTYLATYKNDATPNEPGASVTNYAGTYSQQFGNLTRWRGTLTVDWAKGHWDAQWQARYIHSGTNLNAYADTGASSGYASVLYHSIQVGYQLPKKYHTRFDVGVDNLSNKIPPLMYQNGSDYNVDTSTYDTIGRYFWARVTVKF
ncbi:TonB-dependent receptor plug domain-containing protein [Dyella sp. A6]|uniref:TonB-dependent receptor plug domain-containing protein n=1 Tax=Dyella aluminiiresistens TaxID=3069105 RepID=UPI002E773418|nr:TonB-dependent receptor [Dyella sp. A6]